MSTILELKMQPKCVCGRGFGPDTSGGDYSAPPDLLGVFRGPLCDRENRQGRGWEIWEETGGKERKGGGG